MHEGRHPDTGIRIGVACRLFVSADRAEADGSYARLRKRPLVIDSRCFEVAAKQYRISTSPSTPVGRPDFRWRTLGARIRKHLEAVRTHKKPSLKGLLRVS